MNSTTNLGNKIKSIEEFPADIFLEIFQYLNGPDIIYAFSPLNKRFQNLLLRWVNKFDFTSTNKEQYCYTIQHHDIRRWRSLRLSNNNPTPGQILLFYQLLRSSGHMSQLQSLTIVNMTVHLTRKILPELISFQNLVSLTVTTVCGKNIQPFQLPSLKQLCFSGCKWNNWLDNFHSLKNLEYTIDYECHCECALTLPKTLRRLKLFYFESRDGNNLRNILSGMSQLSKLALYGQGDYGTFPNGWIWENLIKSSLPLLEVFQFCFHFVTYPNESNTINQAISLFATPFYIKRRWFVQCDSSSLYSASGVVYTLPFAFSQLQIGKTSYDMSVSTLLNRNSNGVTHNSYSRIQTLLFTTECEITHQGFLPSNIVRLILRTNIPRSWFSLLKALRYLEFQQNVYMLTKDFGDFLESATQLYSLTLPTPLLIQITDSFKNRFVCNKLQQQIQSLALSDCLSRQSYYHEVEYEELFTHIIDTFGDKCSSFSLKLSSFPKMAKPILQNMRGLKNLNMYYPGWCNESYDSAIDLFRQSVFETDVSDITYEPEDAYFYAWTRSSKCE